MRSPGAARRPARVLVVARSAIRQAGLEKVLAASSEFQPAGICASLAALEDRVRQADPDLVVLDWEEQSSPGDLPDGLNRVAAEVSTIVLIDDPAPELVAALMAADVKGVIPRDSSLEELTCSLESAAEGLTVLGAEVPKSLAERLPHRGAGTAMAEELTERELEVLGLLAEGIGNREIASRLGISERTVKFHISSLLGKMSASNRTEAVAYGIRQGLIVV